MFLQQRALAPPHASPDVYDPRHSRDVRRAEFPSQTRSANIPQANPGAARRIRHSSRELTHPRHLKI